MSSRSARSAGPRRTPRSSGRSSTAATSTRRAPRWCRRGWPSRWCGCSRSTSAGWCPTSSRPAWRTSSTTSPAAGSDRNTELAEFYFGSGQVEGLKALVTELGDIDAKELATFPVGGDDSGVHLRVGKYGPYLEGPGDDGTAYATKANVPDDLPPDELTLEKAKELLANPAGEETAARQPPRDRSGGGGQERPLRPLRHRAAARGRPEEGQAAHRLAVQGHVAGDDHPRPGRQAALAAAGGGRRRRRARRSPRRTAATGPT